jgi:O-methyltransferase domain/Dimerisation domain
MRLNTHPENLLERIALRAGVVPTPLGDTIVAMTLARTIMVATKLGIFEVLAKADYTAQDIATACGLHLHATEVLLFALAGAGYVRSKGKRYALAPVARKWLLKSSPRSLYDYMLFNFLNWTWDERFEDFIRTGEPAHIHQEMSPDEWHLYQRAMRALAGFSALEVARRIPVPRNALTMLDIGGSHGYYSVMLCRLHPGLRSIVFDLPEAVVHASKILAQEGMGERIVHRAGNALTDDLGNEEYDLIFIGNLLHHFDEQANRDIVMRTFQSLLRSHERGWNLVYGRDCRVATRGWLEPPQADSVVERARCSATGGIKTDFEWIDERLKNRRVPLCTVERHQQAIARA